MRKCTGNKLYQSTNFEFTIALKLSYVNRKTKQNKETTTTKQSKIAIFEEEKLEK